jgi:hypothetical protein
MRAQRTCVVVSRHKLRVQNCSKTKTRDEETPPNMDKYWHQFPVLILSYLIKDPLKIPRRLFLCEELTSSGSLALIAAGALSGGR